jgi:hypothetical protein
VPPSLANPSWRVHARFRRRPRPTLLAFLALLAGLLALVGPPRGVDAQTPPTAPPVRCRVGIFLIDLYDLDYAANTFTADFWLWSICPTDAIRPLDTLEFVNAITVTTHLQTFEPAGGVYWATRNVTGVFREDWDLRQFPFDRHLLAIELKAGDADAAEFQFSPDVAASTYDPQLTVPGWRIGGFQVAASIPAYPTAFGDPRLPADADSRYSRLTITIDLVRAQLSTFFQLTAVVYAAFVLSAITYVIPLDAGGALEIQMGLLAAALFATAVNLGTASGALGQQPGLTVLDQIHLAVVIYVLLAAAVAVGGRVLRERGWSSERVMRRTRIAGLVTTLAFFAVNAGLLLHAARTG